MSIYERATHPLNRYTAAKYLMLLFPDLKENKAEAMLTDLLRKGELEPEEKRECDDVGGSWVISFESWARFENRTLWKREEVRRAQLKELKKLIQQQTRTLEELIKAIKKLQVKVEERNKVEWRK